MAKNKSNPQQDLVNIQAQQLALQAANAAADNEYRKKRYEELELPQFSWMTEADKERIALQARQVSLQEELQKATLTGNFQGQPTWEAMIQQAGLTGMLNGQQTLAGQAQQAALTGMVNGQQTWDAQLAQAGLTGQFQGQQTQAAQQQAFQQNLAQSGVTGLYNGQQTQQAQQQAFQQGIAAGQLTGTYNGQQTLEAQNAAMQRAATEAGMTGTYNGQQTQAAQQQAFQQGVAQAGLTGMYNGQQTTDWQAQQAALTGYFGGNATLARQAQEEQTALGMANLAASMQANPFKLARVMQGTPQGMRDIMNAALGKYTMPGMGGGQWNPGNLGIQSTGEFLQQAANPTAYANQQLQASVANANYDVMPGYQKPRFATGQPIQNFTPAQGYNPAEQEMQYAQGQPDQSGSVYGGRDAMMTPQMEYAAAGQQAANNQYNYQPTGDGNYYVYPPGLDAPAEAEQYSSQTPMNYNDINSYIDNLQPVNKINLENWQQMDPFQQKQIKNMYGEAGIEEDSFNSMLQKSMPRYGGPSQGRIQQ